MEIINLVNYERHQRALAQTNGPNSLNEKLANAAFDLLNNVNFVANPHAFLATPARFPAGYQGLTFFHKNVIQTVYHISFRGII